MAVLLADLALLAVLWVRMRRRASWRESWRLARGGPLSAQRFGGLAIAIVGTRWLLLSAVAWKASIPELHPFAFDTTLHALDQRLHASRAAWRHLEPLLASERLMRALDLFYRFWYPALAYVVIRVGWRPPSPRRRQFLVSLALVWSVGSLAAVVVSSAGPVYFQRLTGDPAYAALIGRLTELGLVARTIQEALWGSDGRGSTAVIAGIAAFPSLHVAMPALCALRAWPESRSAALGWWGFTLVTLTGSVALGWHYAVDGYAAIAGTTALWGLAGRLATRAAPSPRPATSPRCWRTGARGDDGPNAPPRTPAAPGRR